MQSNTRKKIAPVIITILFLLQIGPLAAAGLLMARLVQQETGSGGIALWILFCTGIVGAVMVGLLLALFQRLREIDGREEEDAKQY